MPRTAATTRYVPKLGSIVRFAPAGRMIEGKTVSAANKPDGQDFSDWESLGCIETGSIDRIVEAAEPVFCFNASTGRWDQKRTENTDADTRLQIALTLQEVTDYLWQLAVAAETVDAASGAFVPGSLPGGVQQGWVKIQVQVSTEVVLVLDLWAEIRLSAAATIANRTAGWKPEIEIVQLGAANEAGVLGTPES